MSRWGAGEFWCPMVSESVRIRLRRVDALGRRRGYFVQCDQGECQYVDENRPPCPLHVGMFAQEIAAAEAARGSRHESAASPETSMPGSVVPRSHNKVEGETRTMADAMTTKSKLRPAHDHIVVKRAEDGEVTHSGIAIPDTAKKRPQHGTVIAVGPGSVTHDGKSVPLAVKAGDRILFRKYSGSEITVDGEECLLLKEEDVLGIVGA
jgi:chaperonin GroES